CVIQGIVQNGSPQGILSALAPLLLIIVNRDIATGLNLGPLGNFQLCNSSGCLNFLIKNDSCLGSINIGLPAVGNLSSCAGDTAMLCTAGSPTTCVIRGIYQYGSAQGIVSALSPLLLIIANRDIPIGIDLGALGSYELCNSTGCLSFLIKNDSCVGSTNIGLPAVGNLSSCILGQLPADQFLAVIKGIACQLITAINQAIQMDSTLQATFGTFSTAITASLGLSWSNLSCNRKHFSQAAYTGLILCMQCARSQMYGIKSTVYYCTQTQI
ncbi:hypothetical protein V5799_020824, partial [Amblyomma americanum]